jgi:Fe-S cluster assembly protein SufD
MSFVANLLDGQNRPPHGTGSARPAWLNDLRLRALDAAHQLTVPTPRDEEWRFTDLTPLYKLAFAPAHEADPIAAARLAAFQVPEASVRLVFVDGAFAPALSELGAITGLRAVSLATAMQTDQALLRDSLGKLARSDDDAFRAINTAHLHDGVLIHVARSTVIDAPIHLLWVSSQPNVATHPRAVIVAESGADLTVIEDHVSLVDDTYCVNTVTEVSVEPNARVRHVRIQRESVKAFHIGSLAVRVARDAAYESTSIAFGARISRLNLAVEQAGEGARIELNGLALIGDRQLADTHSFVDHAKPNSSSRQLHKLIAGGHAHGVFNGKILIRQHAQKTDSAQQSRSLLVSGRAHIDAKPQLEIYADDVKAAHGATVGQLDAEELFYLESRGIDAAAARNLLTFGFAAEVVERIPVASVARALRQAVLERTESKE